MLCRVEGDRRGDGADRERLVREPFQLRVLLVEREDRCAGAPHVVDPLEQLGRRELPADDQQRLGARRGAQAVEADGQVRGSAGLRCPADQGWRELGYPCVPALVIQVGGHVPRLVVRSGTDDQQPVRRPGAASQCPREGRGPVQPSGRG